MSEYVVRKGEGETRCRHCLHKERWDKEQEFSFVHLDDLRYLFYYTKTEVLPSFQQKCSCVTTSLYIVFQRYFYKLCWRIPRFKTRKKVHILVTNDHFHGLHVCPNSVFSFFICGATSNNWSIWEIFLVKACSIKQFF